MFRDLMTGIIIRAMIAKGRLDVKRMHRQASMARKNNDRLLFSILKTNQNSEIGRKYKFDQIKTIEDYRQSVPFSSFNDYEDYVLRMIDNNEDNLMTSLPVIGYGQSSGSVGSRKMIPITQPEVNVYTRYTVTRMLGLADEYHKKKNGKGLKPGRGLFTFPAFEDFLPNGVPASNIPDIAAKQLGIFYPYILVLPFRKLFTPQEIDPHYVNFRYGLLDEKLMYMFGVFFLNFTDYFRYLEDNWQQLVEDIEKGTISELAHASDSAKEKLLRITRPEPEKASRLRKEFEKGFDKTIISRIWPNMSVICGIGTSSFAPFAKIARNYTGSIPYDFSIYGASEGLFAAVDETESADQLLLIDSCYFEFIPVDDETKTLSVDELKIGNEYEIIITNQSGLYRYRCGDIIKVTRFYHDCPYIRFSYRKGQLLNLCGEKTTEEHMAAIVNAISKKAGCSILNWAVYSDLENYPYHYVLLLENDEGKDLSIYSDFAQQVLLEVNVRIRVFFEIGPIKIRNLKPGSQDQWRAKMTAKGTAEGQIKPVRILDTEEKEAFFLNRIID